MKRGRVLIWDRDDTVLARLPISNPISDYVIPAEGAVTLYAKGFASRYGVAVRYTIIDPNGNVFQQGLCGNHGVSSADMLFNTTVFEPRGPISMRLRLSRGGSDRERATS